jgi:hypothetical protein
VTKFLILHAPFVHAGLYRAYAPPNKPPVEPCAFSQRPDWQDNNKYPWVAIQKWNKAESLGHYQKLITPSNKITFVRHIYPTIAMSY